MDNMSVCVLSKRITKIYGECGAVSPRHAGGDAAGVAGMAGVNRVSKPVGTKKATQPRSIIKPSEPARALTQCRLCAAPAVCRLSESAPHLHNFGVQIPKNVVLCEQCERLASVTARFGALLRATFHATAFETATRATGCVIQKNTESVGIQTQPQHTVNPSQGKLKHLRRRSFAPRTPWVNFIISRDPPHISRKVKISCSSCKQRFLMPVPVGGFKEFLCPRCKKTEIINNKKEYVNVHSREIRDRLGGGVVPAAACGHLRKYQCRRCSKKYSLLHNLADHMHNAHDHFTMLQSVKSVMSQLREQQYRHTKRRRSVCACGVCGRVFRSRRALVHHVCTGAPIVRTRMRSP